ncbi:hypothetical protein [Alcanivorax sp. MD8A]|uniref:hypothetical protein n=1 Tax=Alcanivorax sp. MD8A TaxID=1177157 RepID=UPI0011AED753|nr:hypothetical protein [Alcanivorax sp. MD8A]
MNDPVNSFDLAGQSGEPINRSGTTDMSGRNGRTGAPIEKNQRPPPSNYEKIADSIIKEFFKNLATAITSVPLNLLRIIEDTHQLRECLTRCVLAQPRYFWIPHLAFSVSLAVQGTFFVSCHRPSWSATIHCAGVGSGIEDENQLS